MRPRSRREFLKSSVTAACAAGLGGGGLASTFAASVSTSVGTPPLTIKKGVWFGMLPANLSYADRYKMARDVGFEVVQAPTEPDERKAEEVRKAADVVNIRIDSVMN